MKPISLEELNAADEDKFVSALGEVYESAPWVAEKTFAKRPFLSLLSLLDAMTNIVASADNATQLALVSGHPDLGQKLGRASQLTPDSQLEQASAGLDQLPPAEFDAISQLNADYRAKFGFPFIVCARRHGRDSILRQFHQRLRNDRDAELTAALGEIARIAALRIDGRVSAPERLPVTGKLSTHVLDTSIGKPASGVAVELFELSGANGRRFIASGMTNQDGRTDRPLIADRPVPIGRYELRFAVGSCFKGRTGVADPPFLDVVPLQFSVAEPEGAYHVPLLVTPWSYATYRGS